MNSRRRGIMLIINNVAFAPSQLQKNVNLREREGSDKDAENLEKLFTELHFEVKREDNKTAQVYVSKL